ncbi:MAG: hypothetical protein IK132_13775, partial [Clostridia bacterium]|nr:hypothetical protein [Clostridia bacterium]
MVYYIREQDKKQEGGGKFKQTFIFAPSASQLPRSGKFTPAVLAPEERHSPQGNLTREALFTVSLSCALTLAGGARAKEFVSFHSTARQGLADLGYCKSIVFFAYAAGAQEDRPRPSCESPRPKARSPPLDST